MTFAEVVFLWQNIVFYFTEMQRRHFEILCTSKRAIFSFGFCFALADFLSFWSERWSQSQDVHRGFVEKHAKSLPFDLCELLHFKVTSMETSDFLSSRNTETCFSKDVCLLVGFFLMQQHSGPNWGFSQSSNTLHPLESKKLKPTQQLFLFGRSTVGSSVKSLIWQNV